MVQSIQTTRVNEEAVDAILAAADTKNYDLLGALLGMTYAAFLHEARKAHTQAATAHSRNAEYRIINARSHAGRVEQQAQQSAQGRYWGRNAHRMPQLNRAETELVAQAWAEAAAVKAAQHPFPAFAEAEVRSAYLNWLLDLSSQIRAAQHRRRTGCPPHDGRTIHPLGTRKQRHARAMRRAGAFLAAWQSLGYQVLAAWNDAHVSPCDPDGIPADAAQVVALTSADAVNLVCRAVWHGQVMPA